MTGKLVQLKPVTKEADKKPGVSRFSVYLRLPNHPAIVVNAKCYQMINGMTYFFAEDSKTIGRLLSQYMAIPESVAMFRSSDISHILRDSEVIGRVNTSELIEMSMILAGAGVLDYSEGAEEELPSA